MKNKNASEYLDISVKDTNVTNARPETTQKQGDSNISSIKVKQVIKKL